MRYAIDVFTIETMNHTTITATHPTPQKRFGLLSGPVLLSLALTIGACSSGNAASQPTTTAETPVSTTAPPPPANTEPETPASTPVSDVEAFLDEIAASDFSGVVGVRNGSDITSRAYGIADRENEVPIDVETVFDIGSVSKQFTAAATLRLEMDGLLSVDDTLGEHLPGLPDDKAAITLHQLVTHTGGFQAGYGVDEEPINRADFLTLVVETPLMSAPGDRYEYSNVGYALLAMVIESATGESYETYLRTALFEPSGMLDTGYVQPDWDGHTIAVGYYNPSTPPEFRRTNHGDRFGRPNEQPWDVDGPYWNLHGNGGIMSTAADMLRWDTALMGENVLDATAKAKFFTPHVPVNSSGDIQYAYGWLILPTPMGTPLITHSGGNGIFYADFLRFVEQDIAIFIVTNSDEEDARDLAYVMANLALDVDLIGTLASLETDDETNDNAELEAALRCGFDDLAVDPLPDHPEIETLPDSPAGRTAATFLDVLNGGDTADRLDFANDHVTDELGGDDPATLADGIAELQKLFTGHDVVRILQQDSYRFHLVMSGPESDILLSIGFDETDPERLTCIAANA